MEDDRPNNSKPSDDSNQEKNINWTKWYQEYRRKVLKLDNEFKPRYNKKYYNKY